MSFPLTSAAALTPAMPRLSRSFVSVGLALVTLAGVAAAAPQGLPRVAIAAAAANSLTDCRYTDLRTKLLAFAIGMIQAIVRGIDLDCGCFGHFVEVIETHSWRTSLPATG